ncbi:MAG: phospholipase [Burkholderiaceae bacterium]|nr:MAG: phospholipase [Burkholderiaceae bacterium]
MFRHTMSLCTATRPRATRDTRAASPRVPWMKPLLAATFLLASGAASAQIPNRTSGVVERPIEAAAWQTCIGKADAERLACFDDWAHEQQKLDAAVAERPHPVEAVPAQATEAQKTPAGRAPASVVAAKPPEATEETRPGPVGVVAVGLEQGCRDRQFSELSRFWELEAGSSCPRFGLRAYHPNLLTIADGNRVDRQPQSPNPIDSATHPTAYGKQEARFVISIRTKLASGLLTPAAGTRRDSLWVAYTQQSYWQVFNGALSRPFRNTDYMPELIYVYPTTLALPGGWTWRYSGAGLVHQSNGQSDPLSRSWNRAYLMAGFEKDDRFNLQVRVWKRFPESFAKDNNPDITTKVGRGDLTFGWNIDSKNTLRATYTGTFNRYGSERLEWSHALGAGNGRFSGLRFYMGLFHGYGDSLIDYNFKRTVFSVGLSLVDF